MIVGTFKNHKRDIILLVEDNENLTRMKVRVNPASIVSSYV